MLPHKATAKQSAAKPNAINIIEKYSLKGIASVYQIAWYIVLFGPTNLFTADLKFKKV
jgi:hypothetical protein